MPPVKKYGRDEIVQAALAVAEKEGMGSINARRIAHDLGCSVQPIFHNFENMKELEGEVYLEMYKKYREYMTPDEKRDNPYKQMGLGYIRFAREYPEYFKAIFMQKTKLGADDFVMADKLGDSIIKTGQSLTGLSYELQKKFHIKVWIFTHGLTSLAAMNTISISDDEIAKLLETSVREMLRGFKIEEEIK